jgi:diaminopropionate ammonia-lyase
VTRILYSDPIAARATGTLPSEPRRLHAALPGYAPTPLVELPALARRFDVGRVMMKMETERLGLPSFKILGASWAVVEALRGWLPPDWGPSDGLRALAGRLPVRTLVTATDGNHGRALAVLARTLELPARIYVPANLSTERCAAIAAEGAEIVEVAGSYDEAVARSARDAEANGDVLVSDTSWPGYEVVPAAVVDGYSTILWEVEEQLGATGAPRPDLVFAQLGVGSFGSAVVRHFRRVGERVPRLVGVEPDSAACVMASLAAGQIVSVPGPHDSVMAGLNCGTPSLVAWPILRDGLDATIAIADGPVLDEVARVAALGVEVGECSAAAVAAAAEVLAGPYADERRSRLRIGPDATVLLFATEGVTDREAFARALDERIGAAEPVS